MGDSEWRVIDREAGVLSRGYAFAPGASSVCFAARMGDGKMMVVSPCTGLDDAAATELESFGEVGAIVANNGFHHLGHAEWRERYPDVPHFAPSEAMERIAKKNPKAGAMLPLSELASATGSDVGFREVANTKCGESWYWAKTGDGYAWYTSDVLVNMPSLPKALPLKLLFWAFRSAPGYRVFHLGLTFIVKDKKATLRSLREDLEAHPPSVTVPAHGGALSHDAVAEDTRALIDDAI